MTRLEKHLRTAITNTKDDNGHGNINYYVDEMPINVL